MTPDELTGPPTKSSVRSYRGRSPDHQLNGGSNRR